MRTREEVINLWSDQEKCPDFKPILEELLNDLENQEKLIADLSKRDEWLSYLEAAGVDNWQGIDEAYRLQREDNNQTEDDE